MNTLKIKPNGIIKGGFVDYAISGDSLAFNGKVIAKVGFWTTTYPFSGTYQGTPGEWLQAHYVTGVVDSLENGQATAKVLEVQEGVAQVALTDSQYSLNGIVAVDVSAASDAAAQIRVLHAHIEGKVHGGLSVTVEAEA